MLAQVIDQPYNSYESPVCHKGLYNILEKVKKESIEIISTARNPVQECLARIVYSF